VLVDAREDDALINGLLATPTEGRLTRTPWADAP
jgi:hypothetical protein